ncbi:MAG: hypothetical protein HY903_22925 [Deltaproteobacteria bacterium]|nr:hypothetical protein [Deltaproteobacteria bacterium]
MQCHDLQQALTAARVGKRPLDEEQQRHLASCDACRAFAALDLRLERALAADADEEPGVGFDTRFFARLGEVKKQGERRRWLGLSLSFAAAAAAALVAFVALNDADHDDWGGDIELAMNLELAADLDVVKHLDDVEAFEIIAKLDDRDLDAVLNEAGRRP